MTNGATIPDETAEQYARLGKGMRVEKIVHMIQRDNLRGYQQNGDWFLDTNHQIHDAEGASRANRLGLSLSIAGAVLLGMAPTVLFADWGIVGSLNVSAATHKVLVEVAYGIVGLLGAIAMGLSIAAHVNVLRHREVERARMAAIGRTIGRLGRNSSQVAIVLFGFGLFLLLRSLAVVGVSLDMLSAGGERILDQASVIVAIATVIALLIATTNA